MQEASPTDPLNYAIYLLSIAHWEGSLKSPEKHSFQVIETQFFFLIFFFHGILAKYLKIMSLIVRNLSSELCKLHARNMGKSHQGTLDFKFYHGILWKLSCQKPTMDVNRPFHIGLQVSNASHVNDILFGQNTIKQACLSLFKAFYDIILCLHLEIEREYIV